MAPAWPSQILRSTYSLHLDIFFYLGISGLDPIIARRLFATPMLSIYYRPASNQASCNVSKLAEPPDHPRWPPRRPAGPPETRLTNPGNCSRLLPSSRLQAGNPDNRATPNPFPSLPYNTTLDLPHWLQATVKPTPHLTCEL